MSKCILSSLSTSNYKIKKKLNTLFFRYTEALISTPEKHIEQTEKEYIRKHLMLRSEFYEHIKYCEGTPGIISKNFRKEGRFIDRNTNPPTLYIDLQADEHYIVKTTEQEEKDLETRTRNERRGYVQSIISIPSLAISIFSIVLSLFTVCSCNTQQEEDVVSNIAAENNIISYEIENAAPKRKT